MIAMRCLTLKQEVSLPPASDGIATSHLATLNECLRQLLAKFSAQQPVALAPVIAIVGCDGAGKSTVSSAILGWLRESRAAENCHLGVQSKTLGEALMRLPLVGKRIEHIISQHSRRTNSEQASEINRKGPSTLVAIATYLLSLRRWWRFQHMMALRRRGVVIIADRYPQIAVPRMKIDGPGLANVPYRNALVRFLAERESALYEYMTHFRPALVIRLNVDLATAYARKPDHRYESLAAKIALVPQLEYRGAPIVDLDSRQPLAEVISQAKAAITQALN